MGETAFTLESAEHLRQWQDNLGVAARELYTRHLRECAGTLFATCDPRVRDARLWAEEVFWSRACQEGLSAALEGSLVLETLEVRTGTETLDDLMRHVETMRPLAAAAVQLAASASQDEITPPLVGEQQVLADICRHLACAIAQLRAVLSAGLTVTFPHDPFVVAEMTPPPISNILFEQANLRLGWAGSLGLGDSSGRAHTASLSGSARRARTLGGKIDSELQELRSATHASSHEDGAAPGAIPLQLRARLATMTPNQAAEEFILAAPLVCRRYAGPNPNGLGEEWCPKSRQQFRSAANLATKHFGLKPFAELTHQDFVSLLEKLIELPANHHIPLQDEARTLQEIIEDRNRTAGPGQYRRLTAKTISRHLNNLRLLHAWLGSAIVMPIVSWDLVLRWPSKDNNPKTEFLSPQDVEQIFTLPIWTGGQAYRGTPRSGTRIWHSGTYWVPLLSWYTGIARDVLCGMQINSLVDINGLWCLEVKMGREGLSRDRGFNRVVPLHPEVLRLGFLEYVEKLATAGHVDLFPELRRAGGQSPADVFSSRCWRPIRAALPWLTENLALGAIRDAANKALEDLEAFPEKRCDLFGIRGTSEADLRYTRVTPPEELFSIVAKIPVTTGHLERYPIRLLPEQAMRPSLARIVPRMSDRLKQDGLLASLVSSRGLPGAPA